MTNEEKQSEMDVKWLELSSDYWFKRLDHSLTHTSTSSRLIYIVDGGILALIYFVIQGFGASRQIILLMSATMILLMFLNLLHGRFVIIQREHYRAIDNRIRQLLNQQELEFRIVRKRLASTHRIYSLIHLAIALFTAIAALVMLLYGFGYFEELKFRIGLSSSEFVYRC